MKPLSSYLVLTKQHKKVIDAVGECFCTPCAPVTPDIRGRETHHLAFTSSKRFLLQKPASWQGASLRACRHQWEGSVYKETLFVHLKVKLRSHISQSSHVVCASAMTLWNHWGTLVLSGKIYLVLTRSPNAESLLLAPSACLELLTWQEAWPQGAPCFRNCSLWKRFGVFFLPASPPQESETPSVIWLPRIKVASIGFQSGSRFPHTHTQCANSMLRPGSFISPGNFILRGLLCGCLGFGVQIRYKGRWIRS